eukprot:tig00021365_g20826.t1
MGNCMGSGPSGSDEYDLFLSHRQSTGADLARSIKLELEQMRPGIRVFLDTDALDDIHDLRAAIAASRAFLLVLTPGVFESQFVVKEVVAAADLRRPALILWDTKQVPNFPTVDASVQLPPVDGVDPARVRQILQRLLLVKATQFVREKRLREAALREILDRMRSASPIDVDPAPQQAAPINHGAPAERGPAVGTFKGKPVYRGPRGGLYYVNKSGFKTGVKEDALDPR